MSFIIFGVEFGHRRREQDADRRRVVFNGLYRANMLVRSAMLDNLYEDAWRQNSLESLRELKKEYDELTIRVLQLFRTEEVDVAEWVEIELYSAFMRRCVG